MKLIRFEDIANLNIPPEQFYGWVEEMLLQKETATLPPKISLKQAEHSFYNVMPSVLPNIDAMGVKIVMRYPTQVPSLTSQIILYRQSTGIPLAFMDGTYITALRTGAVAAHSIDTFAKENFSTIGFMGLGNTARATLRIFAALYNKKSYHIKLLNYKDQADSFIQRFEENKNLTFTVCDSAKELIMGSEVVVSCVTYTDDLFADDECYLPGCTIIPVHTRGFQNCDLFFDKVFADDCDHVKGFQHFGKFNNFAETCDVITGKCAGRATQEERILVYNIGISIHDIFFAHKLYTQFDSLSESIDLLAGCADKFWV